MSKQVQLRRGNTSDHSQFTGAIGEITYDSQANTVVVHNGSTAGGTPLATKAGVASSVTTLQRQTIPAYSIALGM